MKQILGEKHFIAYHEEMKDNFLVRAVDPDENLKRWIDLPSHSNVMTALDQFTHDGMKFAVIEHSPHFVPAFAYI